MFQTIIVIFGLILFEVISFWGLLLAVFVMRGLLPFAIVWLANAGLPIDEVFKLVFSDPTLMEKALEHSKPLLLLGGGDLFLNYC